MLPMVVLRRLDCVLEPTKDAVLAEHKRLIAANTPENAIPRLLTRVVHPQDRKQPLYNISPYTFQKLLGDSENIAPNLVAYINGFSDTARRIFEKFKFGDQIEKLDASNRLFNIVKAMSEIDLHPDSGIDNLQMGYLFEHLIMRFNEQANEEAGDHFTPREVIRLMTHLVYTGEEDVYKPGVYREIYDPACGTGGMLSVSEETIRAQNLSANLGLYGQDYNDEAWAICCSDMLIKDEETDNIVLGDTLGDGKTRDGFQGKQFHYMLANPPFGVEWKDQQKVVDKEHEELGFSGRFGAGLPAINDGSLLFPAAHDVEDAPAAGKGRRGSKIAIVFNGSPLFSGDAGSGPSNIRRWIIENDWLDAIVALPDQLFYNTGIFTYVWLVTNRKAAERRGKVQLDRRHALLPEDEEEPQQQAQRVERRAYRAADADLRQFPRRRDGACADRRDVGGARRLSHLSRTGSSVLASASAGGVVRTQPGGAGNLAILATVRGSIPNPRAIPEAPTLSLRRAARRQAAHEIRSPEALSNTCRDVSAKSTPMDSPSGRLKVLSAFTVIVSPPTRQVTSV